MTERLNLEEQARFTAARRRVQRAQIELQAAQAEQASVTLGIEEAYDLGPGDKLGADFSIERVQKPAPRKPADPTKCRACGRAGLEVTTHQSSHRTYLHGSESGVGCPESWLGEPLAAEAGA
jgi:hypothetical protein